MSEKKPIEDIKDHLNHFRSIALFLQITFIFLGLVSVTSSLIVATFSGELEDKGYLKGVAFTAAISSAIISRFSLDRKASDVRTAWRILNVARIKHELELEDISYLIDRYAEAEDTAGHVVFNPPQQEARALKLANDDLKQKLADLQQRMKEIQTNDDNGNGGSPPQN
ncbi:hypothetical protein [Acaryochloris sp. IP29b_bin.137]|uniref:hypothetical protein n=1 Tax=Acaryochloris sp. IP29b_bin.137 TaxID=2969217 RepID=UPI0026231FFE|nr:hypothetical protein [Acaryochloris sp. IP29b_bin.137]